ncbi:DUF6712 family protein [Flavobacterium sp.]|uniref:DUF6712 family protein n=1 Tax=Flavobacterium sp. TaxID=239 RepID=UPI00120D0E62|nr:DUF6712 family protein [Flavobacterium sp.]RZJ71081.1 MAG: hypothetical protein EOO49_11550 [Flavobacterium sp.]
MILENTADLRKYVAVSNNLIFEDFEPYITKAVNHFTYKYLGDLQMYLGAEATGANADVKNKARGMLREALSNFGLFLYFPVGLVSIDSAGITTQNSEQRKTADNFQVNDIRRDLLQSGHNAMDRLLEYLELNANIFPDWKANYLPINQELLVSSTGIFDKWFNIFGSRQAYLALLPYIRKVEDKFIKTFLCGPLIKALKDGTAAGEYHLEVKEYLQKAIVAFTISKVCTEGLFLLDASGLRIKFDTLPHESQRIPDYGLPADQIARMASIQEADGIAYLKFARKIIEAHAADFDQCPVVFINETSGDSGFNPYDTKAILAI